MKLVPPDGKDFVVWEDSGEKTTTRFVFPIVDGVISTVPKLPYTNSFTPPNAQYRAFWIDKALNEIAAGAGFVTVSADPYTVTVPTLTAPSAEGTLPVLDTDSTPTPATGLYSIVKEDITGTKDGANTAFTVSSNSSAILVFLNGQLLTEGTGYSKSTTNITAIAPYIPESGDSYVAVLI